MRNGKIETFCLAMITAQVILFWLGQSSLVGNKALPFGAFVIPTVLGFIVGIFGLGVIVKELLNRQPLRLPLLFACGLGLSSFVFYEVNFGETKFWSLFEISDKTLKADAGSVIVPMSGLDIKRLIKKMARNFGWIAVRYEVLGSSSTGLTETFEFKAGSPLLRQRSDVVVRVVSRQSYSAVIDIRSSSPNKRVDLGFNNMMINK